MDVSTGDCHSVCCTICIAVYNFLHATYCPQLTDLLFMLLQQLVVLCHKQCQLSGGTPASSTERLELRSNCLVIRRQGLKLGKLGLRGVGGGQV